MPARGRQQRQPPICPDPGQLDQQLLPLLLELQATLDRGELQPAARLLRPAQAFAGVAGALFGIRQASTVRRRQPPPARAAHPPAAVRPARAAQPRPPRRPALAASVASSSSSWCSSASSSATRAASRPSPTSARRRASCQRSMLHRRPPAHCATLPGERRARRGARPARRPGSHRPPPGHIGVSSRFSPRRDRLLGRHQLRFTGFQPATRSHAASRSS